MAIGMHYEIETLTPVLDKINKGWSLDFDETKILNNVTEKQIKDIFDCIQAEKLRQPTSALVLENGLYSRFVNAYESARARNSKLMATSTEAIKGQLSGLKAQTGVPSGTVVVQPVGAMGPTQLVGETPSNTNNNGIQEVREALTEINPENLEKAITISERVINLVPFPETKATLRGVHGAIIFDILRSHGHNIIIKNGQVELMPRPGTDVVNLQEKLQTLVNTGRISQDTLKMGMLYSSPTFKDYAKLKKTTDANGKDIIDPRASPQDFIKYVRDLEKSGSKSGDIQTILGSHTMLSGIDMPRAIKGFQDMGQIGTWMEKNPQIVANALLGIPASGTNTAPSNDPLLSPISPPPPSIPPAPGTVAYYANIAGTEAGKFGAEAGKNAGAVLGGIGNTLSGFVKGVGEGAGPLGAGVAVIGLVYAGYKLLTGDIKGHSGFFWSVMALLGGSGLMAGLKRFGIDVSDMTAGEAADKAKKVAEEAAAKAKAEAQRVTGGGDKPDAKPAETPTLTPSQQGLRDKIMANTALNADIEKLATIKGSKYPGKIDDYVKFIETALKDVPLSKLFPSDHKESIFFDTFTTPLPSKSELSAKMLKRVMREYLTGNSTLSGNGDKAGEVEKDKFLKDHNITPADIQNKKLSDILESVHKVRTGGIATAPVAPTTPAPVQAAPVAPAAPVVQPQAAPTTSKNSFKIGGIDKVTGNNVETSVNAPTFDASGNPYKNTATKLKTDSTGVVFIPTGGVVKLGSSVIQRNNIEHIEVEYAGEKIYIATSHLKP